MSSSSRKRGANSRFTTAGALTIALSPCLASESLAQPEVGLEIDAAVFASDNPFLIAGENRASGAVDVAARPYVDWHLDPRTKLEFTGELGFRQYHKHYGNYVTGLADLGLRHRRNEYLTVSGRARYSRDLISDMLTDSIDFAFDSRGVRESIDAGGTVAWNPSATITITGDLGWRKLRYPDSAILQATDAYDVGISASKRLNAKTSVGLQARATSSRPESSGDTSVKSVAFTAAHRFAENWHGDVQLGVEWSRLNDSFGSSHDDRARFNGGANLCYEPLRTSICLNGTIGSEVSGLGGLQRETSFGGTVRHQISEYGAITAEVESRKTNLPEFDAPARVLRVASNYEHRLNRTLYLTSGAAYLQRQFAGAKIDAAIIQIGLSIRGERS